MKNNPGPIEYEYVVMGLVEEEAEQVWQMPKHFTMKVNEIAINDLTTLKHILHGCAVSSR